VATRRKQVGHIVRITANVPMSKFRKTIAGLRAPRSVLDYRVCSVPDPMAGIEYLRIMVMIACVKKDYLI